MVAWTANGPIYDDFRAVTVGTNINGRTTTSGHTWAGTAASDDWEVQAGTEFGGTVQGNVGGALAGSRQHAWIDFGSSDCDIEATLERPADNTLSGGLMVRREAIGDDDGYYYVALASGEITIAQRDPFDVITVLGNWTGLTVPSLSVIRAVCSGNDISAYLNGTFVGSVTDSTYAGTNHGLYQRFGGTNQSYRFYAFNMHPPARPSGVLIGAVVA